MSLRSLRALCLTSFFIADVRDGLGPFLGIFLTQRHWQAEDIGLLMSVGGIAGLLATLPAGFITDSSRHKRLLLAGVCLVITLTTLLLWFSQKTSVVALSQVASGICAAFVGPLIAGITLGLARQRGFSAQMGKNEAFNHAGNFFTALMAGAIAWYWGIGGIFILMACTTLLTLVALLAIRGGDIDDDAARGIEAASTPSLPEVCHPVPPYAAADRRRNPDAVPSRQCRTVADAEHADRRRAGTPQSRTVCRRHGDYFAGGDDPGGHPGRRQHRQIRLLAMHPAGAADHAHPGGAGGVQRRPGDDGPGANS